MKPLKSLLLLGLALLALTAWAQTPLHYRLDDADAATVAAGTENLARVSSTAATEIPIV